MKKNPHAFSLVEVTLALGIVSFALLSMLGLFSVGLQANRESSQESVAPQIVREMIRQVAATPTVGDTLTVSFSDEGFPVASNGIYTATLVVKPSGEDGWGILEITINHPGGSFVCHASALLP